MTDLRRPAPLDPRRLQRDRFSCGEPSLDEWLRRYAGQGRRSNTAATWVVTDAKDVVVAYASLSMSAVDLSAASTVLRKGAPNRIPALLIGRLAVDERLAGMGLGTELVKHALASAVELNTRAACRAVVVTALHEASRRFWQRFGFEPLDPDQPSGLDLYLMTSDIAETLERL